MSFIFSIIIAYLLGSISTGIILSKYFKIKDPRANGSGNPGATNVLRTSGTKAGILVLVGDVIKGLIAMLIAKALHVSGMSLGFVALAAVIGHMFPAYFGFKGGKGVATALGTLLVVSFWVAIILIVVWVVVVGLLRYVSVASMASAALAPILILFTTNRVNFLPLAIMAVLIIWKHKENIKRLKTGSENKITK